MDWNWWNRPCLEAEQLQREFSVRCCNVGLVLGPRSNSLYAVVLNDSWAVEVARFYLPRTATFGPTFGPSEVSAPPQSTWLFRCPAADEATLAYRDPAVAKQNKLSRLAELRGAGHLLMAPPSGDLRVGILQWGTPDITSSEIAYGELRRRAGIIAAGSLILRHYQSYALSDKSSLQL